RATIAVAVGFTVSWFFRTHILGFLTEPLRGAFRRNNLGEPTLHFLGVADPFFAYFKLCAIGGIAIAMPVVFWELWSFISPGLYKKEKRYAVPFALLSSVFFVGGSIFCWLAIFPVGFDAFLAFSEVLPQSEVAIRPTITLDEYMSFSMQLLAAFGIVFELPLLITFLSMAGIVNWKQLWKFSRWFIVIAFVLGAVLTPTGDVGTQLMMAGPLIVLYFVSVVLAYFLGPKVKPEEKKPDEEKAATAERRTRRRRPKSPPRE
ncbi:MAG: twin-arginine translocase subunit TatC, partial [Deltaproteobacteria bacterium]|nr:twin-arginine translocase subunit TatC [Deltaproteobacteria bacterium]